MFNVKYELTTKLLNNISKIERLYGQLEALRVPEHVRMNLERNNLIKSSFHSNSIEGNPLSLPEVTNLLLDDRMPVNRDEKEVVNYFEILKKLNRYNEQIISKETMCELHKMLLTGVNDTIAGKIRNKPIVVGKYVEKSGEVEIDIKHNPPAHKKASIEKKLDQLTQWLQNNEDVSTILRAGIFHHEFVYIHPFEDGNGRVCRLLTSLLFAQASYLINKYFVLDDYYDVDRSLYSDSLHSADQGDKTKWLEYFSDGIKYSMQSALSKYQNAMNTLTMDVRPTPKEKEVLKIMQEIPEITSTQIVEQLHISRQQAHNLLSGLVKKGFVEKHGSTKSSYYMLKK